MSSLALTEDEVVEVTGYRRISRQMAILREFGIPCRRRPDNTVLVLRMHFLQPVEHANPELPRLKSSKSK
ncbi:DUF4224 domain-containing protein [Rugamonas apoptosis]|uniref:DUF4224 domain-containing protein n=1 Tax=Rugamonas apoptosis TaxID=2758570 RepID=A0A7W2F6Q5_9BURK|nr:DUF4224 domain-containing protein [Rugamonas apoptosis]MBA5686170.1 DUF4224 domain-containing protein [Rugamonas apoptosis]